MKEEVKDGERTVRFKGIIIPEQKQSEHRRMVWYWVGERAKRENFSQIETMNDIR